MFFFQLSNSSSAIFRTIANVVTVYFWQNQKSERTLLPSLFIHKEFLLVTGALSAEKSTDIVQAYLKIKGIKWNITLLIKRADIEKIQNKR